MSSLKTALSGLVSAIIISNLTYADEIGHVPISGHNDTHTRHTTALELKPISLSGYKIAGLTFLPDLEDSENGWAGNNIDNGYNKNDCSAYTLSTCPRGATCSKCPFNRKKLKLHSCKDGWKASGNTCVAASCSTLNSTYKSSIPANQICTKVSEGGLICYKDCRNISCSGYTLNCDTFNVANSASKTTCPDCEKADANCSPKLCKVGSCQSGYKIADNGTTCVALDDTCPNGYYKSCETSTVGDPKYTEKGTACYQCKAKEPECAAEYKYNLSNCPAEKNALCGKNCGENYTQCKIRRFPDLTYNQSKFNYGGLTFTNQRKSVNGKWVLDCPDADSNNDFYILYNMVGLYQTSSIWDHYNQIHSCYSGERACLDVYLKLLQNGDVSLDKDIQCGNLIFDLSRGNGFKTYTLNGNGHTITFDKPTGNDFKARESAPLNINNIKIIHKNSSPVSEDSCSDSVNNFVFYSYINVTNADIYADAGLASWGVNFYGTNNFKMGRNILADPEAYDYSAGTYNKYQITWNDVNLWGTLNIHLPVSSGFPQTSLQFGKIGTNAILNYKGSSDIRFSAEGNARANLCFTGQLAAGLTIASSSVPKENIRSNLFIPPAYANYNGQGNYTSDICNENIFSGDFWK